MSLACLPENRKHNGVPLVSQDSGLVSGYRSGLEPDRRACQGPFPGVSQMRLGFVEPISRSVNQSNLAHLLSGASV